MTKSSFAHNPLTSHTTTYRTRDSSNDRGSWCEHDRFREKGIQENYFCMILSLACVAHKFPLSRLANIRIFSLECRRLWWLSDRRKHALTRSVGSGNLDHISPLLLLFINTFLFGSALALLTDGDFWDFHFHSLLSHTVCLKFMCI